MNLQIVKKIFYFVVILLSFSRCSQQHESINRSMLDSKNQKLWDYYHSVDYCQKVNIFDSLSQFEKNIYYSNLNQNEKNGIYNQHIYKKVPNSFYGYIFWDIVNHTNYFCCSDLFVGGYAGTWWLDNEFHPQFHSITSPDSIVFQWKTILKCDTLTKKKF